MEGLYAIADKHHAEAVTEPLKGMLIPRFLETAPLRVYALASRWRFEEEAKIATRSILTMNIMKDFPRKDAELMGGGACQQLYLLNFNPREATRALVEDYPRPVSNDVDFVYSPLACKRLFPALCQRVSTIPWLTA